MGRKLGHDLGAIEELPGCTSYHDDELVGVGYSGHYTGLNNPLEQSVHGVGPIPAGAWIIGPPKTLQDHLGLIAMLLAPCPGQHRVRRSAFFMHETTLPPTTAQAMAASSAGLAIRAQVRDSGDHALEVLAEFTAPAHPQLSRSTPPRAAKRLPASCCAGAGSWPSRRRRNADGRPGRPARAAGAAASPARGLSKGFAQEVETEAVEIISWRAAGPTDQPMDTFSPRWPPPPPCSRSAFRRCRISIRSSRRSSRPAGRDAG